MSSSSRRPTLWPTLCDPNQLENALLNLVINSRDAMPNGGNLLIETANAVFPRWRAAPPNVPTEKVPAGEYVALLVSDTGAGMTPNVVQHAFDPFYTTKPTGEGTGLGLSMIHGFVQQSGGHVLCCAARADRARRSRIDLPETGGGRRRIEASDGGRSCWRRQRAPWC